MVWNQDDGLTELWELCGGTIGGNFWQMLEAEAEKYKQAWVHSRCSKKPR